MWPHFAINPDAVPPPEHRQRMIRAYLTAVHTTETSSAVFDAGPSTSTIKEISGVTPPVEAASPDQASTSSPLAAGSGLAAALAAFTPSDEEVHAVEQEVEYCMLASHLQWVRVFMW